MTQDHSLSKSARALSRIVEEGVFTVAELADVAECSQRHLYNVIDDSKTTELSAPKVEAISRYLCKHGDFRLAYAFLGPKQRVVNATFGDANGCVRDDLVAAMKALTGVDDSFSDLDEKEGRAFIEDLDSILADLRAEFDALEGRR